VFLILFMHGANMKIGCEYVDFVYVVADRVQWQSHVKTKVKYEFLVTRKIPSLAYWLRASQIQLRVS